MIIYVETNFKEAHFRQLDRLHQTFERLFDCSECIGIDATCFRDALGYQQKIGMEPQDSIIYAAIVADLHVRPGDEKKYFFKSRSKSF